MCATSAAGTDLQVLLQQLAGKHWLHRSGPLAILHNSSAVVTPGAGV
jgi:hypothetical protein